MSTLFENFYDSFCNEVKIGSQVFFQTTGMLLLGTIVELKRDKKGEERYKIIPNTSYRPKDLKSFKSSYTVSWKNVFLAHRKTR